MRSSKIRFLLAPLVFFTMFGGHSAMGQTPPIRPVSLGQPMPDFTLPVYQGGEMTLSSLRGKTVLIVFPRGLAGKDHWCHICNYQHSELAEAEKTQQIRKKYNLEILFVFPYSREMIAQWIDAYPQQLKDIEAWKNPTAAEQADEKVRVRMDRIRREMPKSYQAAKGEVPTPFRILFDEERTVSKGLGIFAEEWGGSKIEQNIPTVYIVDPKGNVQFKYISQNTFDRPGLPYLIEMIESTR